MERERANAERERANAHEEQLRADRLELEASAAKEQLAKYVEKYGVLQS